MKPPLRLILVLLLAATSVGCDPTELISNAPIDRWCGERPCNWEVKGEIKRVGTWHPRDYAVQFVSDDAQISQLNEFVATGDDCYDFTMLAKVERGTRLFLELDFLDDGVIDTASAFRRATGTGAVFRSRPRPGTRACASSCARMAPDTRRWRNSRASSARTAPALRLT